MWEQSEIFGETLVSTLRIAARKSEHSSKEIGYLQKCDGAFLNTPHRLPSYILMGIAIVRQLARITMWVVIVAIAGCCLTRLSSTHTFGAPK